MQNLNANNFIQKIARALLFLIYLFFYAQSTGDDKFSPNTIDIQTMTANVDI